MTSHQAPSGRPDYVELRCRSAFSFLDGASLPEDLVAAAAAQGHDTLALGDVNGLYGAPRFHAAARRAGVQAIVGAEVALESEAAGQQRGAGAEAAPSAPPPVLLLVESRAGYQNLCRLLTAAHADRPKGTGAVTHAQLAAHAQGLVALAGAAPRADLPELRRAFGPGRLYVEAQRHLDAAEAHAARAAAAQAAALDVPVVATNDVRYATPERRRIHDVLTCARHGVTVDDIGRLLSPSAERRLKSPAEMAALFRDQPAALRATRAIAERCAFTLADLGYTFPKFPAPPGETEESYLRQLAWAGAADRYRPLDDPKHDKARRQLERELDLIGRLELGGYFLLVWDIVQYARAHDIMVQGRGSAANSALCYALGITAVDPVGMDLLFERFLSEERVRAASSITDRMPDIDLDLPSGDKREQVIQYVYGKHGARGAAMTANVISYRPRLAMRTCGRALGFAEEQLDRIAKGLPGWLHGDPDAPLADYVVSAGFSTGEDRARLLAEISTELLNLPRHLGQHSGGMVIAAGRLDEVVPLEPASMPGRVVVQWDKDDCADMGIVKVDLLGLGMMAVLEDAVPLVARHEGVTVDYAHLPPDDPKVYAMLRAADTVGMFQVESRAQMATLPRMKPERFYDLVVEVAIIRPGPIVGKMLNPYLERRAGRQKVRYPHPSLEPILKRTLGIPLFQEQLIRMAMVASGFTGGQADELRRAMGFKRSQERMNAIEVDLRAGMAARGITGAAQDEIVQGIKSFALYGFPESHAASFALLAYASAYLKAYHPAAFLCALLNNYPMGFYHPSTLVTDAARHGVVTLPVDVTRSKWRCDLERPPLTPHSEREHDSAPLPPFSGPLAPAPSGPLAPPSGERVRVRGRLSPPSPPPLAVRLGLKYVDGLREEVATRIEAARAERPFTSLGDFEARVRPNAKELANLAAVGAFAALGGTRRQALWQVEALGRSGELFERESPARTNSPLPPDHDHPLPEMSAFDEMVADLRHTGINTGPHPMAYARASLRDAGVLTAAELAHVADGARARVAGIVIVRQRPGTAKGFVFVTVEDETGFANAIVTPQRFATHRRTILALGSMIIEGVVQNRDGVVTLKADGFAPLPSARPGAEPSPGQASPADPNLAILSAIDVSHDFH